ncbi:MAG: DNA ligase D [Deltaproteobacteria bacterium]|nr:DNA ligase D [Deltaproteobacteria bacterium]
MAPRDLKEYRDKRDAQRTPEPFGAGGARPAAPQGPWCFIVQQHDATGMHWDVRLEIDGVLTSFAVPRGISLDHDQKKLAVLTEDHPLEYAHFEGIIPKGNYGAGAMILWDRGQYRTVDGRPPREHLAEGKLDLLFHGLKMRGRWALVRIKGEGNGKQWLMFHKPPRGVLAQTDLTATLDRSVLSGLTVAELDAGANRTAALVERARTAGAADVPPDAADPAPMLAESASAPFTRDGWVFEIKLDGIRALVIRDGARRVRILTRAGREVSASFPEIARAARHLPADAFVLDGEIVALDAVGKSSFELLQQRLGLSDAAQLARMEWDIPAHLFAFDLLRVGDVDVTGLPLTTRKELLQGLVPRVGVIRFHDHLEREGELLFDKVRGLGLEGLIAKRAASRYQDGRRTDDWQKVKPLRTVDVVVVGASPAKGNRKDLGALLVAWHRDGALVYCGRVGSGFDDETRRRTWAWLQAEQRDTPAFQGGPERHEAGTFFVEPNRVVEVKYTEVTAGAGLLRHPVFLRERDDKTPHECTAPTTRAALPEPAPEVQPAAPSLKVSNRDKVYFPADGLTKGDLLRYYEEVWPWISPYLRDRPVVLTRYPDGIDGKNFYQKNAPPFTPEWVETVRIEDTDYFVCNTVETLLYVINSGAIPLHVWSARRGSLDTPDWCILDLDPKEAPFHHVVRIARHIHQLLSDVGAPHFVKTSGQAGMHILIPLHAELTHAESRMLAELLARAVVKDLPDIATVERALSARGGKVYVDHLQNGFGKLIAGTLSVRPRPGAPVSTPLTWDEVDGALAPAAFTLRTVPARLQHVGDPMRPLLDGRTDVPAVLLALSKRLGG